MEMPMFVSLGHAAKGLGDYGQAFEITVPWWSAKPSYRQSDRQIKQFRSLKFS